MNFCNPAFRMYSGGLKNCPYCDPASEDAWILTEDVMAVPHPSPFAAFHIVVAPRRHVTAFYDLDVGEQRGIWDVIGVLRDRICGTLPVTGFDIGFQDAPVDEPDAHAVIHVMPRMADAPARLPGNIDWIILDS
jgi:diadenosine tetraphosphate (Ap4A) HIT family hydrolase